MGDKQATQRPPKKPAIDVKQLQRAMVKAIFGQPESTSATGESSKGGIKQKMTHRVNRLKISNQTKLRHKRNRKNQ